MFKGDGSSASAKGIFVSNLRLGIKMHSACPWTSPSNAVAESEAACVFLTHSTVLTYVNNARLRAPNRQCFEADWGTKLTHSNQHYFKMH